MTIRQASSNDSTAVLRLLAQLGYEGHDETFILHKIEGHSGGNYHLLIGDIDGEVAGFISMHWFDMFHSEGFTGRITSVCVDDRFRSQGIGKQLLGAAEKFLASKDCKYVEVTCNLRRVLTHEFYRKNGYSEDSKRFIKNLASQRH